MGNQNLKEISIRSCEPNISNLSFNLKDNLNLIPFVSNTINKVLIDCLNKSTSLNIFYPNSFPIDNDNELSNQQIKFAQMIGDLKDKNIQSNMENKYSPEEEVLYNNLFQKTIYKEQGNNDSTFNISLENISSINESGKSSRNETSLDISQISVNLTKPIINTNNNNKQKKVFKIGKKEDFQISLSKEKNKPYSRPESQNNSSTNQQINLSVQVNSNLKKRNKKEINIPKQIHKKSISPKQKKTINKNPLIPIDSKSRKVRSNEKKNNNSIIIKKNISPFKRNSAYSPIKSPTKEIINYFNLPKTLCQSPTQSESINYSHNQSTIKPHQIYYNQNQITNSYVKLMKMKKAFIEKKKKI